MNRLDLIESHAADVAELAERLDHAGDADGFARALASFIELAGWKHSGAGRWHRARRSHHRGPVPPHRRAVELRSLPAASPEPLKASELASGSMHAWLLRFLATTLLLCGLGLLVSASVGAAPPPPKFWSVARCEQALRAHDLIHNAEGHGFHAGETICVGTGGPAACKWTAGHRSRLYSEFAVFTRSRYVGTVVRSFMLTTRGGPGLVWRTTWWRPVRRMARLLLLLPNECEATGNAINSGRLPLDRRSDYGSPRATRERERLHGP